MAVERAARGGRWHAASVVMTLWCAAATAQAPPLGKIGIEKPDRVAAVLAPRRQAVLAAEVSGRVKAVERELGEAFEAGQVLVRIDERTYQVNLRMAEAEHAAAQRERQELARLAEARTRERQAAAVLAAARANLAATQRLFESGQTSQVELENARRDLATAEADCELVAATVARESNKAEREVELTAGRLELARAELAACTVRAPYAGRVAHVLVNAHERVERGTPLLEIVDDRVLLAKFLLPSALFSSVTLGQELELTVTETGAVVPIRVSHISAVLDAASGTFEVHGEADNASGLLRAGMNGHVSLAGLRGP